MLDGVRILAWRARDAVRLGATLLERAGAQVAFAEEQSAAEFAHDVIVVSSDVCPAHERSVIAAL